MCVITLPTKAIFFDAFGHALSGGQPLSGQRFGEDKGPSPFPWSALAKLQWHMIACQHQLRCSRRCSRDLRSPLTNGSEHEIEILNSALWLLILPGQHPLELGVGVNRTKTWFLSCKRIGTLLPPTRGGVLLRHPSSQGLF